MLQKLAAREPMSDYPTVRRLQDFRSVFGNDLPMLEVRMLRFIETLK